MVYVIHNHQGKINLLFVLSLLVNVTVVCLSVYCIQMHVRGIYI